MTDRDTKLRAVAARFLGWEPELCEGCDGIGSKRPPDPRDPAVFVALLEAILPHYAFVLTKTLSGRKGVEIWTPQPRRIETEADTLADALLDAAYQLTQQEKP